MRTKTKTSESPKMCIWIKYFLRRSWQWESINHIWTFCYVIRSSAPDTWADRLLCNSKFSWISNYFLHNACFSGFELWCLYVRYRRLLGCWQLHWQSRVKHFMTLRFLRSLHFADNQKVHKSNKAYKLRPVIDHLNLSCQSAVTNADKQAIGERKVKFKRC